jgi:hypothetical protein
MPSLPKLSTHLGLEQVGAPDRYFFPPIATQDPHSEVPQTCG